MPCDLLYSNYNNNNNDNSSDNNDVRKLKVLMKLILVQSLFCPKWL